ncbi:CBS domain-containing protein [Candidatus Woesearchaeota archaeon]|nr:CBS domain-containing protein [Candidatus Woesearchaeota archaeon]
MKVKEVLHRIMKISSDTSVAEAARIMSEKLTGSVLVEEDGDVIGIMTERDMMRKVVAKAKNANQLKVKDIMSTPLITIDANEDILEASRIMDRHRIRRLIVVEDGKIIGKVTANSISRNLKYLLARDTSMYSKTEYYGHRE